jgi:phosphoenolpyruvate carboxylase
MPAGRYVRVGGTVAALPARRFVGGGDRDGNPFVTAASLERAVRRGAETAIDHHLAQIHALGSELSLSDELVPISKALSALAEKSSHESAHKADEPYRRALTYCYERLAATRKSLLGQLPALAPAAGSARL